MLVRVRSTLHNVFIAQLVLEHSTFNGGVTGSNPVGDTIYKGRVEQLVGSSDCKSVVERPWGFESLLSHKKDK
jgi:hypothetical protein